MLNAIAIVPSSPLMVPQLASSATGETEDLRGAAVSAAAGLPSRWIAVGVDARDGVYGPPSPGTFAGYGVDVRVSLSAEPGADEPTALPLCALIAAWLRGQAAPQGQVEVRTCRSDLAGEAAVERGRQLRTQVDSAVEQLGVLIVADGANTLTPAAPGGHDPASASAQAALDDALAAGDTAALRHLPASILGRVAYQVLAGLAEPGPGSARELYRGAPYGVGYFVGIWTP
ncbi:hypothetical protein ACNUDN_11255 [Mycobacterium sp. smrl_JER01]|uniref:hypothetical protein n=1 Tax=Mycobacterium sp. smrl_JER01 TaxID=3402633 RepID=UPI003AC22B9C